MTGVSGKIYFPAAKVLPRFFPLIIALAMLTIRLTAGPAYHTHVTQNLFDGGKLFDSDPEIILSERPPEADSLPEQKIHKNRLFLVGTAQALTWAGTYLALNKAWYADYPRSRFHLFNDNREWLQMDKAGHVWTTYQIARASAAAWKWAGLTDNQSAWVGGISGMAFQSIIEIQDGFSDQWGFSWGDMAANLLGAATFVSQESEWKEQRIQFKFSYWQYKYEPDLISRRNQLFGKTLHERLLKDYNSQTIWASFNIHSLFSKGNWPSWLNIAVGYKTDGMLGGHENKWTDDQGNIITRYDIPRKRYLLLSPDIDFTKIHSGKKWVRTLLFALNSVKMPAPALQWSPGGVHVKAISW